MPRHSVRRNATPERTDLTLQNGLRARDIAGIFHAAFIVVCSATSLAQTGDGINARFMSKSGVENRINFRLTPETAAKCTDAMDLFPTFRPRAVIECNGEVVDVVEIPASGEIQFRVPMPGREPGSEVALRIIPSAFRTPKGEELIWNGEVIDVTGDSETESSFLLDVGYPTDTAYLGRRFSYQEGPSRRPEPWTCDRDYRWAEPDFTFRLPIAPGNRHEIRLIGHVPVGFRLSHGDQELARFEQPQSETNTYSFQHQATATESWLTLRVEPIAPFPSPNLDLRSLFFALERVEVRSHGKPVDWSHLPASSLVELAFRSMLPGMRPMVEPTTDWESSTGAKTAIQYEQELAAQVLFDSDVASEFGGADRSNGAAQPPSLSRALTAITPLRTVLTGAALKSEIAILIPDRQLGALRACPSNNFGLLTSAFGAFAMLCELQIPPRFLTEAQIPADTTAIRCIIVPNPTWMNADTWTSLTKFADSGGVIISTANVAAFGGAARPITTSLFGAEPREYHRYFFTIPFGEKTAYVPNSDWQANLARTTAEQLAPLLNARGETPNPPPPAVIANHVGAGIAVLMCCDSFDFYARFGAPAHRDLVGWIINQFVSNRALRLDGGESLAVSTRATDRARIVGLLNMSRGHFDYGGLMNSARPIVFVEDVPPTGPVKIRCQTGNKIGDVTFIPTIEGATWSWKDGELLLQIPKIYLWAVAVATYADAPGS